MAEAGLVIRKERAPVSGISLRATAGATPPAVGHAHVPLRAAHSTGWLSNAARAGSANACGLRLFQRRNVHPEGDIGTRQWSRLPKLRAQGPRRIPDMALKGPPAAARLFP